MTAVALSAILASLPFVAEELKVFSHKLHLDSGVKCEQCHDASQSDKPKRVDKACGHCHHGRVPGSRLEAKARPLHIGFLHQRHAAALGCEDCHKATVNATQKNGTPIMTVERCFACHAENGIDTTPKDCAKCHGTDQRRVKPPGHSPSWAMRHGRQSEWRGFLGHGEDCSVCHAKRECTTCHLVEKPKDHTGLWRTRMHGRSAALDRDRCKTCHETGACISCHRRTKPANHAGAWRSFHGLAAKVQNSEHCAVCHSPAWCARCHRGER
jgi:hypothetical protein